MVMKNKLIAKMIKSAAIGISSVSLLGTLIISSYSCNHSYADDNSHHITTSTAVNNNSTVANREPLPPRPQHIPIIDPLPIPVPTYTPIVYYPICPFDSHGHHGGGDGRVVLITLASSLAYTAAVLMTNAFISSTNGTNECQYQREVEAIKRRNEAARKMASDANRSTPVVPNHN